MTSAGRTQGVVALVALLVATGLGLARWDLLPQAVFACLEAGVFVLSARLLSKGQQVRWWSQWPALLSWSALAIAAAAVCLAVLTGRATAVGSMSHHAHDNLDKVASVFLALAVVTVVVYGSSAIDTVWVLPNLDGSRPGREMPCVTAPSQDWTNVTRTWLLHRLIAWIVMIVGGAVAFLFFVSIWFPGLKDSSLAAVAAVATVLAGFYISRVAPAIAFILNPPLHVGDVIALADEPTGSEATYYVMDVAMEGFKLRLLTLEPNTAAAQHAGVIEPTYVWLPSPLGHPGHRHDRVLDLADIGQLLRRRDARKPCDRATSHGCTHVNPYCPVLVRGDAAGTEIPQPLPEGP